jgi:hypothetical protein
MQDIIAVDGEQQPYRQMLNKEDGKDWRVRINLPLNYTKSIVTDLINERLQERVPISMPMTLHSNQSFTDITNARI